MLFLSLSNQFIFVYSEVYEGGGILFGTAVNRVMIGLIISQVLLFGILLSKSSSISSFLDNHEYILPIILLPLPFYTYYNMKVFDKKYFQPSNVISLEIAREVDKSNTQLDIADVESKFPYRQPLLDTEPVEPLLREREKKYYKSVDLTSSHESERFTIVTDNTALKNVSFYLSHIQESE